MNGILERIEAKLDALLSNAAAPVQTAPVGLQYAQPVQQPVQQYAQPVQQPVQQYAQPVQQPVAAPTVTAEQLTALIMPHIDNAQVKEALGIAMREVGINALPEAQPHQYGDLYQRFQAVLVRFGVGGGPAPTPPASTSLI